MVDLGSLPALLAAQDWTAAERLLRRAAAAKGAPAEVFYNLARVLDAAGKGAQRQVWLKRALALRPDYGLAWYELGRAALEAGNPTAARTAFAQALRCLPDDPDARVMLGRLALRAGDWDGAAAAWDGVTGPEADAARYRVAAERGQATPALRAALLADPKARPEALKALTRTAKGAIPLRLPRPHR